MWRRFRTRWTRRSGSWQRWGRPRQRGEKVERGFAHLLVTGGMRRVHLRGQENIRKRMLIHAAAFNLGLLMRKRCGFGTPRGLQGLAIVQAALATQITTHVLRFFRRIRRHFAPPGPDIASSHPKTRFLHNNTAPACLSSLPALIRWEPVSSTGFYDDRNRAPAPYRGHPGESESCECHFSDNHGALWRLRCNRIRYTTRGWCLHPR